MRECYASQIIRTRIKIANYYKGKTMMYIDDQKSNIAFNLKADNIMIYNTKDEFFQMKIKHYRHK